MRTAPTSPRPPLAAWQTLTRALTPSAKPRVTSAGLGLILRWEFNCTVIHFSQDKQRIKPCFCLIEKEDFLFFETSYHSSDLWACRPSNRNCRRWHRVLIQQRRLSGWLPDWHLLHYKSKWIWISGHMRLQHWATQCASNTILSNIFKYIMSNTFIFFQWLWMQATLAMRPNSTWMAQDRRDSGISKVKFKRFVLVYFSLKIFSSFAVTQYTCGDTNGGK